MRSVSTSSRAGSRLPPVDAHLMAADSGYEVIEGRLVPVAPADEPHGDRHSKVNALLEAFVTESYNVACDMLTRTSETSDVAPDASVYPIARDPDTGGRRLEVLAFQVVATETLTHAAKKAALPVERGVKRVFALDVARKRVLEWSRDTESRQLLPDRSAIEDEIFIAPLPVEVLVGAAKADDAMAAALLAKRNPVLVASEARARAEGHERACDQVRAALLAFLETRGLDVTPEQRRRIDECRDLARFVEWSTRVSHAKTMLDVFEDDA
jgi:Uma2 family endonuclease